VVDLHQNQNILVVDDEKTVNETVTALLSKLGFKADSANNVREALGKLEEAKYTFLISDMPDINGIELIEKVRAKDPNISIIAMTGYGRDYTYVDVINAGANDFIVKPFLIDEMNAKITRILRERKVRDELAKLSITDNLTGLFNQRHFYHKLAEEVDRARRQKRDLSLILLDLDSFKIYNDTHGHLAGDAVLMKSGEIIQSNIRENVDMAFRYGGDEFAVILVEADSGVAEGISARIKIGFERNCEVKASVGYATYSNKMEINNLISLADKNLYAEKEKKGL
jgi:two-component system cell cycle response regulator